MTRLVERMKRCLRNEVILYYDGEYWWAHDPNVKVEKGKEEKTIIFKHSVIDVVLEGIEAYFYEKEMRRDDFKDAVQHIPQAKLYGEIARGDKDV